MEAMNVLKDYVHAVLPYWWALLTGAAIPLVDLIKWHGREFTLPRWLKITATVLAFFVAQFLAYRDSLRNLEQVKDGKSAATSERDELLLQNTRLKSRLDDKDSIVQSQQNMLNAKLSLPRIPILSRQEPDRPVWHTMVKATAEADNYKLTTFLVYPTTRVSAPVRLQLTFTAPLQSKPDISIESTTGGFMQEGPWIQEHYRLVFTINAPDLSPDARASVSVRSYGNLEVADVRCLTCP